MKIVNNIVSEDVNELSDVSNTPNVQEVSGEEKNAEKNKSTVVKKKM